MYAIVRKNSNTYSFTTYHDDISSARKEAERLCQKENQPFIILKAIELVQKKETPCEFIDLPDDYYQVSR